MVTLAILQLTALQLQSVDGMRYLGQPDLLGGKGFRRDSGSLQAVAGDPRRPQRILFSPHISSGEICGLIDHVS